MLPGACLLVNFWNSVFQIMQQQVGLPAVVIRFTGIAFAFMGTFLSLFNLIKSLRVVRLCLTCWYFSFGEMVACFRYASIKVHSVYLPPPKLDFTSQHKEWVEQKAKEVMCICA